MSDVLASRFKIVFHTLLSGWIVSLSVRVLAPRMLGEETFGYFASMDAIAQATMVLSSWGFLEWSTRRFAQSDTFLSHEAPVVVRAMFLLALPAFLLLLGAGLALGHSFNDLPVLLLAGVVVLLMEMNLVALRLAQFSGDFERSGQLTRRYRLCWGILACLALASVRFASLDTLVGLCLFLSAGVVTEATRLFHLLSRLVTPPFRETKGLQSVGQVLGQSFSFFAARVSVLLYLRVPALSLTAYLAARESGLVQMGHFGVALTVNGLVLMFIPALQSVLLPHLALLKQKQPAVYSGVFREALVVILILGGLVAGGVSCASGALVPFIFGEAYASASPVVVMSAPSLLLSYALVVLNFYLVLEGREKLMARLSFGGLLLTIATSLCFVHLWSASFSSSAVAAAASLTVTEAVLFCVYFWLSRPWTWANSRAVFVFFSVAGCLGLASLVASILDAGESSFSSTAYVTTIFCASYISVFYRVFRESFTQLLAKESAV
jgi:O-antigen/teichoic acid export membrane protein